jgi:TPR repeat protein
MSNDVFISCKNLDEHGVQTRDAELAAEVYDFLTRKGLSVFLSTFTLEQLGVSDYTREIDLALESATVLLAIGTSADHLNSKWVRYEWDSFANDIRTGIKSNGRIFTYVEGMAITALPRALRQTQTFEHRKGSLERLYNFINKALLLSAERHKRNEKERLERDRERLHSAAEWLAEAQRYIDTYDYTRALPVLQKAAEAGNPPAMNKLGWLYENNYGVARDYGKAREWYQRAVNAGDADAMANLGSLYEYNCGVVQDYGKAHEWYQKAVDAGNSYGMYKLGSLYDSGHGVARDDTKAREWWQRAADAGNADAMYRLGWLYRNGKGVAQDKGKAREWFQKAADKGETNAIYHLGEMYCNGEGGAQDYGKAYEWYHRAADVGDRDAMYCVGWLYDHGYGVAQDYCKAHHWYEMAALADDTVAMYNVGYMYENGEGVARDYEKAREWYQKAADKGYEDAREALEHLAEK